MLFVLQVLLQIVEAMLSWVMSGFDAPLVRMASEYSSGGPRLPALEGVDEAGGVGGGVEGSLAASAKEMFLAPTHPSLPSPAFTRAEPLCGAGSNILQVDRAMINSIARFSRLRSVLTVILHFIV